MTDISYDARTGQPAEEIPTSALSEVDEVLAEAAAAAPVVAATPPAERKAWLYALADALGAAVDELVAIADRETGLGDERLRMEIGLAATQLRYYADIAVEGWLARTTRMSRG